MKTCDAKSKCKKIIIILGRLVLNQPRYYNSFFLKSFWLGLW
jgi:hypothetical protein